MKKKFVYLIYFLILLLISFLISSCMQKSADNKEENINIGVIIPLSKEYSPVGISIKNSLDLYEEQVNDKGGLLDKKVKFIYADDEGNPEIAAKQFQKLCDNEKIIAAIGSGNSECSSYMSNLATINKIPLVSPISISQNNKKGEEYFFNVSFDDYVFGEAMAKFALSYLKIGSIDIVYANNEKYQKERVEKVKEAFEKNGGKILSVEPFMAESYFANLKSGALFFVHKDKNGKPSIIIGDEGLELNSLQKNMGDIVTNIYMGNGFSIENITPESKKFNDDYQKKFKKESNSFAALGYDSGKIIINAIEKAKSTDGEKIKDALKDTEGIFVTGNIKFDKGTSGQKSVIFNKLENNKWKYVIKINTVD